MPLGRRGLHFPECSGPGQPLAHTSVWERRWLLPYLYSLAEAFQGIDIQPFLAGLQAGDHLLTLHLARADGETGQAAVEELGEPRFGDFSSWKRKRQPLLFLWGWGRRHNPKALPASGAKDKDCAPYTKVTRGPDF